MPSTAAKAGHTVGGVVIGGDYQGLGIVRSLGKHGIPVCIIDDEFSIARFSRFAHRSVRVRGLRDPEACVETVLEIGRRLGLEGWVLYPTRDETVAAIAINRARLAEFFRVPTPEWDITKWATDKRNTYRLAGDLGIAAPRTWYPSSIQDLEEVDGQYPYVLKPAKKEHFVYATKAKAWRVETHEQLVERFREAAAVTGGDDMMVQELVPGDGRHQFAYCAFFKDGRAVASMAARRRRQHPPEFGRASTFVQTVDMPQLSAASEKFLRAIDYYGLVEVEYKRDPRDGTYKLLDVNARTWGYHTLGAMAGLDFPYLLFKDQVGEQIPKQRDAKQGVRWVRLLTDIPTAAVEIRRGRLNWRAYLRSLRGVDVEAVFDRKDPLPGLVELALIPYLYVRRGF
ncbi:MAG: ATP-grasp domain-containing protein [Gemmatimonadaceae bacterium]|nr:ATP-grasp domain-containing protein [Gemmatimonadaceae bacterium]